MRALTPESAKRFLDQKASLLGSMVNSKNQTVNFYEHPTRGDEDHVYVEIEGVICDSGLFETDDMENIPDYEPILVNGKIDCRYTFSKEELTETHTGQIGRGVGHK